MRGGLASFSGARLAVLGCAALASLALCVAAVLAHGGPPLRIGVTADPALSAIGRLALVHLREGVGFGVDWREFPDEPALRAAFAGGRIDVAVGQTEAGQPAGPVSAECPPETLVRLGEALRRRWGGETYLLGFALGPAACARPSLIVARAVLEDLRFGILGKETARLAALLTREDVAAVQTAARSGGERAATATARAALAARSKR